MIDRQCGSGHQVAHFAVQGVLSGACNVAIACGNEFMSRVPVGTASMGRDAMGPDVAERYAPGLVSQGIGAELIAAGGTWTGTASTASPSAPTVWRQRPRPIVRPTVS